MADYSQGGRQPQTKESLWSRYKAWVASLDRGQLIRYRILQVATVISLIIIVVFFAGRLWIREPVIPNPPAPPSPPTSSVPGGPSVDNPVPPGPGDGSNPTEGIDGAVEISLALSGRKDKVYTFLLAGLDVVSGSTDTMILVTYDTVNKTVNAMSLPRDTMVNVAWSTKKLNTVYNYSKGNDRATRTEKGMAGLGAHIGKLTGIVPDFYVVVEWKAVGELVDALDGVTFNVPYEMNYDDPDQNLHIHQAMGERRLTGDDAMQVIRWRKNNKSDGGQSVGDTGRMKIQQDFLVAVAKELLQPKNILKIPELVNIFTENVATNIPTGNLLWLAQQAIGMDVDQDIHFYTMPYIGYNRYFSYTSYTSYVLADANALVEMVNEHMNPYNRDVQLEDLELLIKNSDGSFYLTSGTLVDDRLARAGYRRSDYAPPATTVPETPEDPESPEVPEDPDPGTTDPGTTDPGTANPGTTDPGTTDPGTTDPGTTNPGTPDPGTEPPAPSVDPNPGDEEPSNPGGEGGDAPQQVPDGGNVTTSNAPQSQGTEQSGVLPAWPTPVH